MTAGRDTTPNAHAVDHPGGGSAATLASSSSADDESSAPSPLMDHAAAMPPDDGSLSDEEWLKRALDAARERDLVRDRLETLAASDDDGGDAADRELDRIVDDDASRAIVRGGDAPGAVDRAAATAFGGWIPCDADADRTLLVDNYDSYTYNLYHLIAAVDGAPPVVVRNDAIAWRQLAPSLRAGHFARVVLSPGPGTPDRSEDVGICADVLSNAVDVPVLGVCLGHQALAAAHGGVVGRAPVPMHGRLHVVVHDDSPLFAGIPSGGEAGWTGGAEGGADDDDGEGGSFVVTRYHSLAVHAASLPECLIPCAWTARGGGDGGGVPSNESATNATIEDAGGVVMALRHRDRPHYGVQFHPESVCSRFGERLYRNFAAIAKAHNEGSSRTRPAEGVAGVVAPRGIDPATVCISPDGGSAPVDGDGKTRLMWMRLPGALASTPGGSEALFWRLFGGGDGGVDVDDPRGRTIAAKDTFWLDSATASVAGRCPRSRFSFMGGRGGGLWRRLVYALPRPERESAGASDGEREGGEPAWRTGAPPPFEGGTLVSVRADGTRETFERIRLLDWLDARLAARSCDRTERVESWGEAAARRAAEGSVAHAGDDAPRDPVVSLSDENIDHLPFDFRCGFVGYFGYEMRAECDSPTPRHVSPVPDAALYFADRVVAVDHSNDDVYLLALVPDEIDIAGLEREARGANLGAAARAVAEGMVAMAREEAEGDARSWMAETERTVLALGSFDATRGDSPANEGDDPRRSDSTHAGLTAAIGARAVAALDACERMRREEATQEGEGSKDAGAAYAYEGGFTFRRDRDEYVGDVSACQRAIDRGETYEVCLTNELRRTAVEGSRVEGDGEVGGSIPAPPRAPDPATLYSVLRRTNPAPYAAFLCFGGCDFGGSSDVSSDPLHDVVAVCCSSPERFLRLSPPAGGDAASSSGVLEAKPIKGTAPRVQPLGCDADVAEASKLASSVKDRAENLMIVDLLRNDLGRVCAPGTVSVPGLMKIESYAAVHQLVSTVRGTKRAGVPAAACVAAAFPPGSMTGAPKFRTVEIIDTLEPGPRGVYSGSVGYLSVPRESAAGDAAGAFDLNVVIRTAVVKPGLRGGGVWVGSGGAITALSDPVGEWEEMTLKARAVLRAIRACDEAASGTV
jgi:para-aminobenzoate synthetase